MPYKKKTYTRRPPRRHYKKKFMPRSLAAKRTQQISTKTFYFKDSGRIYGDNNFNSNASWTTLLWQTGQPHPFPNVPGDFNVISRGYLEYKILAIKLNLYAANVGSEEFNSTNRGMTILWKDQDLIEGQTIPSAPLDIINLGSARVIPSRASKWSTTIYRSRGNPTWGNCDLDSPTVNKTADSWSGAIHLDGTGVSSTLLWYWTTSYKVIFRGRAYGGDGT